LGTPSPGGKHAHWWMKVYSSDVGIVTITHRAGRETSNADTLSKNSLNTYPPEGIGEKEVQIVVVRKRPSTKSTNTNLTDLLSQGPQNDQS